MERIIYMMAKVFTIIGVDPALPLSHTLDRAPLHPYPSEAVDRVAEELAELTPDR